MRICAFFGLMFFISLLNSGSAFSQTSGLSCEKFAKDKQANIVYLTSSKGIFDALRDLGNIGWGPYGDDHTHSDTYSIKMTLDNGVLAVEHGKSLIVKKVE